MESWRKVWREGFVPRLTREHLMALRDALARDDPRLIQGATTNPPPLMGVREWPVEAACLLGFCGWQGGGLETVGQVEDFFAKQCFEADQTLGVPAACRWFLNWYDDTPRDEMRRELLAEVELALTPPPPVPPVTVPFADLTIGERFRDVGASDGPVWMKTNPWMMTELTPQGDPVPFKDAVYVGDPGRPVVRVEGRR